MQIAAINSPPIQGAVINPNAAENRRLASAVRTLNDAGTAGAGRQFSFSIDPSTKRAVVRIVNAETGELVEQLPSEYILAVDQELSKNSSLKKSGSTDKEL